jgi:hypothetical protein
LNIDVLESEIIVPLPKIETGVSKLEQSILSSIREADAAKQDVIYEIVASDSDENSFTSSIPEVSTAKNLDFKNASIVTEETLKRINSAEEKLEIGKPLAFNNTERHSFYEWLQLSKLKPISRDVDISSAEIEKKTAQKDQNNRAKSQVQVDKDGGKDHKKALIDKFIESNPKIEPAQSKIEPVTLQVKKIDSAELMTETLARVYLEQKKFTKAIQAYEILILKYPEKSSFFADRILEIKVLQQNTLRQ